MTEERLYEAIGELDEKYVKNAREYKRKRKSAWMKWGAMVACLCVVIGGVFIEVKLHDMRKYTLTGGKQGIVSIFAYFVDEISINKRLSEAEIAALREKYPIHGTKIPETVCMVQYSFEEAVEMANTVIYGEVTGDYESYFSGIVDWYEYPVNVIEDTEGLFLKGEQIFINHTEIMKDYYGTLSEGMKVIVPVIKDNDGGNRYNYSVIGMYYVTEDGYVISAYDEESLADQVYSGMKGQQFLEKVRKLD